MELIWRKKCGIHVLGLPRKMWIPSTKSMLLSTGMYIYIYVFNILYYTYYIYIYIYDAQWIDWMETTAGNVGVLPSNTEIVPWMFPETRFITPAGTRSFAMGAKEWIPIYYTRDRRTNAKEKVPGFQGCNVIRQGSKVLQGSKIPQLQVSSIARLLKKS